MKDFAEILDKYGALAAKEAVAQKEIEILKKEIEEKEKRISNLELQHKNQDEYICKITKWADDLHQILLDACAQNKLITSLPPKPENLSPSITNNFYSGAMNIEQLDSQQNNHNNLHS